ncbi:coil containing protein [Vibrio phage 137E35-1]|nr:coil containing protein [Vibrio phage 137E35-1]CAH9016234.1 coil containing protein [Vibrio phage 230E39-1]
MATVITGKCTYCQTFRIAPTGKGKRFKLCRSCASDQSIIDEKVRAIKVTQEIRAGLPKLYKELRNEANNER